MLQRVLAIFVCSALVACDTGFQAEVRYGQDSFSLDSEVPPPIPDPEPGLGICSALRLDDIDWPERLPPNERRALGLALNVSGSFEGNSGFQNLTGNFDGQGISFGLFQQNLGQGSLQPLLIEMFDRYPNQIAAAFAPTQIQSILKMLSSWQGAQIVGPASVAAPTPLSLLDDPLLLQAEGWLSPFAALSPRNAASVRWAVREILTSAGQVRPDWRSAFLRLGATAGYRSIQVESAIKIHEKALDYFVDWKFKDLRSYLFLVDIVVQNGGFYSVNRSELASFLQARPGATESEQLKFLLERRLRFVRSEYVTDVRARKITIIDGRGRVHGRNRNLPLEYCFSHTERL